MTINLLAHDIHVFSTVQVTSFIFFSAMFAVSWPVCCMLCVWGGGDLCLNEVQWGLDGYLLLWSSHEANSFTKITPPHTQVYDCTRYGRGWLLLGLPKSSYILFTRKTIKNNMCTYKCVAYRGNIHRYLEMAYWTMDTMGQPLVDAVASTVRWREAARPHHLTDQQVIYLL